MTNGAAASCQSPRALRFPPPSTALRTGFGKGEIEGGICARGNVWNVYSVRDPTTIYSWVDGCRAQGCHGQLACPCPTSSTGGPAASGTRPIGTWGLFFLLVPAKENCSKLKLVPYAPLA